MSDVLQILRMELSEMNNGSFIAAAEKMAGVLDAMAVEPLHDAVVAREILESAVLVLESAIDRLKWGA